MKDNQKVSIIATGVEIKSEEYEVYIDNNSLKDLFKKLVPTGEKFIGNLTISVEKAPERIQFEGIEDIKNIESEEI